MASPGDREPPGGLGRSLIELFRRSHGEGTASAPTDDGLAAPPSPGAESVPDGAPPEPPIIEITDPAAAARELGGEVHDFLTARGPARERSGARIRALAAALVRVDEIEPVSEAVLRLTTGGGEEEGEAEVEGEEAEVEDEEAEVERQNRILGRALLASPVAARLAARLGAVRDSSRRAMLIHSLSGLGAPMARAAGDALASTGSRTARRALTDLLVVLGEDGAEVLGAMVRDERWYVVRNAVLVLGETGGEWATEPLRRALAHPDERVRREALLALARIGGSEAGRWIGDLLDDPEEKVREAAALAVGALRERSAVDPLLRRLEAGDSDDVLVASLRALGRIGDPRALEALQRRAAGSLLSRSSTEVRVAAYRALGTLGTAGARAALRSGLQDRTPEVRDAVRDALRGGGDEGKGGG